MTTTTLCYIENEGKYLMLHRVKKKNDINEGKWLVKIFVEYLLGHFGGVGQKPTVGRVKT